jgi:hypothetical protein
LNSFLDVERHCGGRRGDRVIDFLRSTEEAFKKKNEEGKCR